MATQPKVETLIFRDRSSATIAVTDLGLNRFRIDDLLIGICSPGLRYGDIVKAERVSNGLLVVQRRVEKGGYRTFEYVLSQGWEERKPIREVLEKVQQLGGDWEGVFGGVLIICLPSDANYDPSDDIAVGME